MNLTRKTLENPFRLNQSPEIDFKWRNSLNMNLLG